LKKVAASEIDFNETALHQLGSGDKVGLRLSRQKSESAKSLAKLLVSIIKMFKLTDGTARRKAPKPADTTV
jgi:hypothetical protein